MYLWAHLHSLAMKCNGFLVSSPQHIQYPSIRSLECLIKSKLFCKMPCFLLEIKVAEPAFVPHKQLRSQLDVFQQLFLNSQVSMNPLDLFFGHCPSTCLHGKPSSSFGRSADDHLRLLHHQILSNEEMHTEMHIFLIHISHTV